MFRLVWTMMGPGPNKNPSGCLRQLYWHFFPVVHLKETAKRFILGGVSKCVSKMQSAWLMFVTDRLRCWANLEKTKCILGMRVKILLPRKSQSVQSGIKAAWVLSANSQSCNLQNHKLQKTQITMVAVVQSVGMDSKCKSLRIQSNTAWLDKFIFRCTENIWKATS